MTKNKPYIVVTYRCYVCGYSFLVPYTLGIRPLDKVACKSCGLHTADKMEDKHEKV